MIRLHHNCTAILQVSKRSASTGMAEANLHWSGLSAHVPECEAGGGVWGHAPLGNFFDFDAVRWLLRLFLGPKYHY